MSTENILEVLYSFQEECITDNHIVFKEGD